MIGADASDTKIYENLKTLKTEGMSLLHMLQDIYNTENTAEKNNKIKKFTTALYDAANNYQRILEGDTISQLHNDKTRVTSSLNTYHGFFGGAIWNLAIMPGILKYKIPVSITNWTATLSKEIDSNGNAAYCDFTVACQTDQDKSAIYWLNQIYSSDTDSYKLDFAKKNNKD